MKLVSFHLKHPVLSMVFYLLLLALTASGIPGLTLSVDYKNYFDPDYAPLTAYQSVQANFSSSDNIFIGIETRADDIFKAETLAAIERLTEQAWLVPYAYRVDSITNFSHTFVEGDDLLTEPLFEASLDLSQSEIKERRHIATTHTLLKDNLVSQNGRYTGINITVVLSDNPSLNQAEGTREVVLYVRKLLQNFERDNPLLKTHLTGQLPLNLAFAETSEIDTETLFPIMFLVMGAILLLIFRSISFVVSTIVVAVCSLLMTLGMTGWLKTQLTPEGISAFTMIIPIAVADSVHVFNIYLHYLRKSYKKHQALMCSISENFKPILVTSITTICGFMSLNFSQSPPMRMIGNTVSVGVLVACIFSLGLLPALLSMLPTPKFEKIRSFKFLDSIADAIVSAKAGRILVFSLCGIVALCVLGFTNNKLDQTITHQFSQDIKFRKDLDWVGDNLTGIISLDVVIDSKQVNGITTPEYLRYIDTFSHWLRAQEEVVSVRSFSDIVKQLNQTMNEDQTDYYRVPDDQALASQLSLLYELSLPEGLGITNQVNFDKSSSRLFVSLSNLSDQKILGFSQRAQNWHNINGPEKYFFSVVGVSVMYASQLVDNLSGALFGMILSLFLISMAMIYVLGSFKLGALSLIPNLLPIGVAFGVWGLFVGEIGLVLTIVLGMTLGIVVDDTIHFLHKYKLARQLENRSPEQSIQRVFNTVGPALFSTSMILCCAFTVLATSYFQPNAHVGAMTALIVGVALLIDLLFLPFAILVSERFLNRKTQKL